MFPEQLFNFPNGKYGYCFAITHARWVDNFIIVFHHSIINKKNNRKLDLKAKILPRFSEIGDLR